MVIFNSYVKLPEGMVRNKMEVKSEHTVDGPAKSCTIQGDAGFLPSTVFQSSTKYKK
jgi:hypothetical protein